MAKDVVEIELDGRLLLKVSEYRVRLGIFRQPGNFDVTLGRPVEFRKLAEQFPPKTPYRVFLNGRVIQTGLTDGFTDASSDATKIRLSGRGPLAKLVDTDVADEVSFVESTYFKLVETAIELSGLQVMLTSLGLGGLFLIGSNESNRKAITGTKQVRSLKPDTVTVIETEVGETETGETKRVYNTLRAKAGTNWIQFLNTQLRRVGLFLWESTDGAIIVSYPNIEQRPIAQLVRRYDTPNAPNNILSASFTNDTTRRHSECIVYGRESKQAKSGVNNVVGRFIDDEMVTYLNRKEADRVDGGVIKNPKIIRDKEVKSNEHAANLARQQIAEERRSGWKLSYRYQGHTLPGLLSNEPVLLAPDTIIEIQDDEYGLQGELYIEETTLVGDEGTTYTMVEVLRPEDCFFRAEVESTKKATPKPRLDESGINTKSFVAGIRANHVIDAPIGLFADVDRRSLAEPDPFSRVDDLAKQQEAYTDYEPGSPGAAGEATSELIGNDALKQ